MPRIMKNFATSVVAKVAAAQATASKKNIVDHKAGIEKLVGKNFEQIGVGDGVVLSVPKDMTAAALLAQIRGKLVPATREGETYAGRVYKLKVQKATDDKKEAVLFWREDDGTPKGKKVGGRKPGTPNKPKAEAGETVVADGGTESKAPNSIADAKAAAQAHLGTSDDKAPAPQQEPEVMKASTAKKGGNVKDLTGGKKETTTA